ncbi:MAG: hypothetical protein ACJ8B6_05410 [Gemmatimonadales bacterium]
MNARALLAALLLAISGAGHAATQTVCTITVNSPDEREVFRRHLPGDRFEFVELVERGNPDWLGASCRKGVRCDVLLVSGHFAGTEFYSSRLQNDETLPVDVLERAACSDSCPGLFENLKEVYLFGCDTLNPTPVRVATPEVARTLVREGLGAAEASGAARALAQRHGESAHDHMRRLFSNVPVIYGFSSKAPYGRVAGPLLERHFQSAGGEEIGTGHVSERLRRLFAPASMVVTTGQRDSDPNADYRAEVCRYHDMRVSSATKLAGIHAMMGRSMADVRLSLDRIEKFMAGLSEAERVDPEFIAASRALATDAGLRGRYLTLVRDTEDPAVRVRLIKLARTLGWLRADEERAETMRMVADVLAGRAAGFGEVDLICGLNRDRSLDAEAHRLAGASIPPGRASDAALACLGDSRSRARILGALASRDEGDVQLAQAYLRHQPIDDAGELRSVALDVARMDGSAAQARALETLARHHIADDAVLERLAAVFMQTRSLPVQRAIAEIFIRSNYRGAPGLGDRLRKHRLRSPDGADLIDTLISRL